jgi:hypothetical protein
VKITIQKMTGMEEQTLVECGTRDEAELAYEIVDKRLWATNRKIVEAREFIDQVKDPNYRYQFTAFLDSFLGISSQAESLLKKFNVTPPPPEKPVEEPIAGGDGRARRGR